MKGVFIVSAVRTAVGRQKGYFREYMAPELLALALNGSVEKIGLDVGEVDDVITGCVYQIGEQGFNLARMGVLASRLPETLGGITVNRQCGSSLSAIQLASGMIASGIHDVIIASGCVIGLGTGIFFATNWAMGTDLVPKQDAGRYMGISNLAGAGAGIVGAGIGGPMADFFNHLSPGLGYIVIFGIYGMLFLLSVATLSKVK